MRLAVLADIHGNLLALEAALRDLKTAGGVDKTWVLGDLCFLGPRPQECLQIIRELPGAQVISGNTDRELVTGQRASMPRPKEAAELASIPDRLRNREKRFSWTLSQLSFNEYEYLAGLPGGVDMRVPDYGWVVGYHGTPGNDEGVMRPDTPDDEVLDFFLDVEGRLGFGGHTHLPMDRDLGSWRVVNVGSVGIPRDEMRACYALVTFDGGQAHIELRRVEYDFEAMIADLKAHGDAYSETVENFMRLRN